MQRLNESRMGAAINDALAARVAMRVSASPHTRHATTILVGLDGPVTVRERGQAAVDARAVVVPPHRDFSAAAPGPVLELQFDPERIAPAVGVARPAERGLGEWLMGAAHAHRAAMARPDVLLGIASEVPRVAGLGPAVSGRIDRRVARVAEALRDPSADRARIVAATRLSPAHLQALFARDIGLPMRTYQLWHRLLAAIAAFSRADATTAAHGAGFSDLAHFSRTCRRMFGNAPTELARGLATA